ncbi:MAG TPA: methylated-DNA--[protein]-cysteine S-methyltransferase [Phycisphaerales bacterium]|nr:methylated-DNA--[protein]-cysteine S-methyltransferase [Phycisphaerales bacterium]HMP37718.1 methylated-DNA--[protein]-cysteine S-methyltransferase [Phycisphaerales bacterium]
MTPSVATRPAQPRPRARPARDAAIVAWRPIPTPLGDFVLAIDELGRLRSGWQRAGWPVPTNAAAPRSRGAQAGADRRRDDLLESVAVRLARYFDGESIRFEDLPVPEGTPFQRACWSAARSLPYGATISYAELARRAEAPGAARAAGQAMRRNPLPIIVPCHRIVASGGALHGFAGSTDPEGIELHQKRWLLELESRAKRGARGT